MFPHYLVKSESLFSAVTISILWITEYGELCSNVFKFWTLFSYLVSSYRVCQKKFTKKSMYIACKLRGLLLPGSRSVVPISRSRLRR